MKIIKSLFLVIFLVVSIIGVLSCGGNSVDYNINTNKIIFVNKQIESKLIVWEDVINTDISVKNLLLFFNEYEIDIAGVIIDSPWETEYNNFKPDTNRYNNLRLTIQNIKDGGLKVFAWITPYVNATPMETAHSKYEDFLPYSLDNGRILKWWKGEGLLIDFRKNNSANSFLGQNDDFLSLFDGFKVDQIMEDAYLVENKLYQALSIEWVKSVKKYFPDKIILSRGYSHQGGIQSDPGDLNINWGGDFSGDNSGILRQYSVLCDSLKYGYYRPLFEIGGYNPPFASLKEFKDAILISAGFPFASIGGKGIVAYQKYIETSQEIVQKLKYRQTLAGLIGADNIGLSCVDNFIKTDHYFIFSSEQLLPDFGTILLNYDSGQWVSPGNAVNAGIYFRPGVYCFPHTADKVFIASQSLNVDPLRTNLCFFFNHSYDRLFSPEKLILKNFNLTRERYNLIILDKNGHIEY